MGASTHRGTHMKIKTIFLAAVTALLGSMQAFAAGDLNSDQKDACEAVLCLAAGNAPHE